MHRFLLSAAHKSSGKTTVATGLAAALRARGLAVQPFKKGPDYIDPMWLALAAGRPCRNLDFHLSPPEELVAVFQRHAQAADVALVEGNKGLYDGLDLEGRNSNAALARLLGLPVVLVLDARGMTRGVAPLILGYQAFDREVRIAGVILNRLGGARHEAKLRAVIEHYTDVRVVGAVAEDPELAIVERHLGLVPPSEAAQARRRVERLGEQIGAQVDLAALLAVSATAQSAALLVARAATVDDGGSRTSTGPMPGQAAKVRVAIARDRAFGFYYADDLEALEAAGARLVFFDTLADPCLPPADALFIGGGFPECSLDALAANRALRESIRRAVSAGLPTYAECGGLMYLARSIAWRDRRHEMVGAIAADVTMHERPVGRGYVELRETGAAPWPGAGAGRRVPAHEFHYSSLDGLAPGTRFAWRVERGHGIDGRHDGLVQGNLLAAYSHLRSTPGHDWAARFVAFARRVAAERELRDAAVEREPRATDAEREPRDVTAGARKRGRRPAPAGAARECALVARAVPRPAAETGLRPPNGDS